MKAIIILSLFLFLAVSCVTKRSLAGYQDCVEACLNTSFTASKRWFCDSDLYDQAECLVNDLESYIELNCSIVDTIITPYFKPREFINTNNRRQRKSRRRIKLEKKEIIKINRTKRLSKKFTRYDPYELLNRADNYEDLTMIHLLSDSCAFNESCKRKYQCQEHHSYSLSYDACRNACK